MTRRVFNFGAGPAALPLEVLERVREELLDARGTGMSVMEWSHRGRAFEEVLHDAEARLRRLMNIPEDYAVLFLQGGGSQQFAMVPMNLAIPGRGVDFLHTGVWTAKAMEEHRKLTDVRIAASTEAEKFRRLPRAEEIHLRQDASYCYLCSNNTIEGTQWLFPPDHNPSSENWPPTVADMSSDFASRVINVRNFGLIFAGAQKNLGPAGVTIVILRRDLAERAPKSLPAIFSYRAHMKEPSLYHTPPVFAIYVVGLVLEWLERQGGIAVIEQRNAEKARLLYDAIDASEGFYHSPVEPGDRSQMNVVFRVCRSTSGVISGVPAPADFDESLERQLVREAEAAGFAGLAGHRSVGGLRVSLYNAVTREAVQALAAFLQEFAAKRQS